MIKHKRNSGFTLLEMAVALAILSLMAAYMTPNFLEQINEDRANATIQETQAIMDAARVYRRETGTWPGGATCSTAWTALTTGANPYLAGVTANNKYNSPYILSCTSNNFRVQQNLTADWDSYVANKLPGTTITNPATYTIASSVGIPGTEPALSSKLSRIATGNPEDVTMRTDLLLGGNDITGVGAINASTVSVTGATNTGSLAVTGNATVAGTTQTGTLGVTRNALIGGNAGVVGTTTLNGAITANSTSRFNGAADFREIVKLNKVVTEGSACSDIGALARTSTGLTLSCQSGVWKSTGGGESVLSRCLCTDCGFNGRSCTPTCPSGYSLKNKVDTGDWSVTHNRHRIWVGICQQ